MNTITNQNQNKNKNKQLNTYKTPDRKYKFVTYHNNGVIRLHAKRYHNKCLIISIIDGLRKLYSQGKIHTEIPAEQDFLAMITCGFDEMISIGKCNNARDCTDIVRYISEVYGVSFCFYNNQYSAATFVINPQFHNVINILNIDMIHFEYIDELIDLAPIVYQQPKMSAEAARQADENYVKLLEYLKNLNDE